MNAKLRRPLHQHPLIVIEGLDAAGKATHTRLLGSRLEASTFSFPAYQTPTGSMIRAHLGNVWRAQNELSAYIGQIESLDARVFQCVQTVNKLEMLPMIKDALDNGPVILDRFWPSALVYGVADGLDEEWLWQIHAEFPPCDAYVLLDVDPSTSLERRPERRDRYENDSLMGKRAEIYRRLWADEMDASNGIWPAWFKVDARGNKRTTHDRLVDVLDDARIIDKTKLRPLQETLS